MPVKRGGPLTEVVVGSVEGLRVEPRMAFLQQVHLRLDVVEELLVPPLPCLHPVHQVRVHQLLSPGKGKGKAVLLPTFITDVTYVLMWRVDVVSYVHTTFSDAHTGFRDMRTQVDVSKSQ